MSSFSWSALPAAEVEPAPEYVPELAPVDGPDAEGELMPVEPVVPFAPAPERSPMDEPEVEEPGEVVLPVPLPMDPDVPVPDPDVLGEADGAPLSEIPATCIAC